MEFKNETFSTQKEVLIFTDEQIDTAKKFCDDTNRAKALLKAAEHVCQNDTSDDSKTIGDIMNSADWTDDGELTIGDHKFKLKTHVTIENYRTFPMEGGADQETCTILKQQELMKIVENDTVSAERSN